MMDHVFIEIGHREDIHDKAKAEEAAEAFVLAVKRYPEASRMFFIGGYDEDPRELWQIDEAMQYVRWFAKASGLDNWRNPVIAQLGQESIGLLVLSESFADDHPFTVIHE